MKLTENQIHKLYKFTREHFVAYYDVQTELVDHLANDIEAIWATQPQVSFEKARDLSFKKFGVFGFMDVITEKQKAMHKKYWKILWRFTKEWFELPKILTTAVVFLLFFSVLQSGFAYEILLASFIALMAFELFYIIKYKKKKKQQPQKRWLLQEMIGETRTGLSFLAFVHVFNTINAFDIDFTVLANHWIVLIAAGTTLMCILFYVATFVLPQKATELLEETYPEYKIS